MKIFTLIPFDLWCFVHECRFLFEKKKGWERFTVFGKELSTAQDLPDDWRLFPEGKFF
jgi:hypothetical protein